MFAKIDNAPRDVCKNRKSALSSWNMNRKELATGFLKMVVARKISEAYERYISPQFVHHNQHCKGDRQSLLQSMEQAHEQFPDTGIQIKHIYEDGDTVITHSLVQLRPGGPDVAVVHISRFEGQKIAELWDLGQVIVKDSPNQNGPF